MEYQEGDLVWFDPGLGHPLPGEIQEVHRAAQVIIVQAVINGKPQTFTLAPGEGSLQPRQDLGSSGVEDMTQLDDLHEASLLWNLRLRYDRGLIYTFAGSILIAVNPYKMFPNSYGLEVAKQYAGKPLGQFPPHLFAIGAAAHAALPSPQAVVISGESGSGKTESTKLVMQYLAAVVPGGGSTSAVITEQILEAAPLLEAFGNARTAKNDNSSRFGKYLEVYFKSGAIVGAKITQYLLEKSRIVTQAPGERNYHVFYELLGGLSESERNKYGLLEAEKYFYLNQGGSDCAPGRVDWPSLLGAMQVLGVSDIEREGIVRVLASVLHLGNVYFHRRQLRHGQEGVELGSDAEIKWAAHLLQISSEGLQRSITTRITETRNEIVHTPLGIDQALDARDAFAKALYAGLFNWLVSRINSIVHKGGTHDAHRISILDIFGFEDLAENSFEQLCINYANENLHLYFNKHVFKLEQAEYARERLEWTPLTWEDNLPVIHLMAKKPVGIFHLLDDESNFPRASDFSFLEKCHYNHALSELYSRPRIGAQEFGIKHYAGQVWYCVEGFLEKNRDALRLDVIELLSLSKQPLVMEMTRQMIAQRDMGKSMPKGSNGRFVTMKPRTPTVAARFSDSLQQLLQSMAKCNPWFVRCIKPNNDKQALRMDMPCVLQQLRYLGMLDTIKIRQTGYPVRLRFQHFVERYKHMLKKPLPRGTPYRELCRNVLETLSHTNIEGPDFQLGATRVFLREALHRLLENARADRLRNAAVIIQRNVRGLLTRKKLHRRKRAAVKVQSVWRSYQKRKEFERLRGATVKAQALYRGRLQRKRYAKLKNELKRKKEAERVQKEKLAQRIAKEQSERSPILHLDVPAELAFIFSKLDGWSQMHGDRNLVKVVGTVPGPPPAQELPQDIDQFAFGKFSSVYCNGVKLAPRRDPITVPFLSRAAARDHDFQDSLAVFKLILRWTGDTTLDSTREKVLADYIVHKGLSSRGLRDEILVQLCNQVYRAEEAQQQKIWLLMSHCLSSFQPGAAFSKYLIRFVRDNAPSPTKELLLKKLLRNNTAMQTPPCRLFPSSWLEWRASTKVSDIAIALTLPDGATQTVAIDSWTTCEEAANLAVSAIGIPSSGWTVVIDDSGSITDSCGLDFVLDLVAEKELSPAFPAVRTDLLRCGRKSSQAALNEIVDPSSPKRPQVPPPAPPSPSSSTLNKVLKAPEPPAPVVPESISENIVEKKIERVIENRLEYPPSRFEAAQRKTSHDLLSRNSALNERYFEPEKSRSRSLDDLLAGDANDLIPELPQEPEMNLELGLSGSRLNDRYHSVERIPSNGMQKDPQPRYVKSQYAGKRSAGSHSSKYMDKSEYSGFRSSAMSDTSETPSLASHVRRVRVPSQASDVDQFLDELFSPVLDGSLDELSDARSLAASIRGGRREIDEFLEAPLLDDDIDDLINPISLVRSIKGGGTKHQDDQEHNLDREVAAITNRDDKSLDEYITDLFQPIFVSESLKRLTEKSELVDAIKGGGTAHHSATTTNGFSSALSTKSQLPLTPNQLMMVNTNSDAFMSMVNIPPGVDPVAYHQQVQRAFLQSAMAQNIQIQQQLLAQNQALQTLLSQDPASPTSPQTPPAIQTQSTQITPRKQSFKSRISSSPFSDMLKNRKASSESNGSLIPPPPPPPMPPLQDFRDPSEIRPFLDPYGRAKTVRIGKWRWPPPQDSGQMEMDGDFMIFKMRQNQRKTTPQSQNMSGSPNGSASAIEWEEFDVEQATKMMQQPKTSPNGKIQEITTQTTHITTKSGRRSFDIGADRPPPGSVGKLKLSSEMRQRLEQVTSGHSVRSTTSTRSDRPQRAPAKLEDTRRLMLEQQLAGNFLSSARATSPDINVRNQIQRMEAGKRPPPPPWPAVLPPAPPGPAPPPPIRPPTSVPPVPPPPAPVIPSQQQQQHQNQTQQHQQHQTQQHHQQQHHQQQQQQHTHHQQQHQQQTHHQQIHHQQSHHQQSHHQQTHHQQTHHQQTHHQEKHHQEKHHQEKHHQQQHHHVQQQNQQQIPQPQSQTDLPSFVQRQERDTFGVQRQSWNAADITKEISYDSWGRAEAAKLDLVYETNFKKENPMDRERSRSRSRSRDRENFSESVWDRAEVEGPPSASGSDRERDKEREKRDRIYEMRQVEREKESNRVYQPANNNNRTTEMKETHIKEKLSSKMLSPTERATFKTHMVSKSQMERERKSSASTLHSVHSVISEKTVSEKADDVDSVTHNFTPSHHDDWPSPVIPAPVHAPASIKNPATACLTYNRVPWKLRVRKEVFHPNEPIGPPVALDLLFAQVASDVFGVTACLRISLQEKRAAMNLLGGHGVTQENMKGQVRAIVKRHLIDMARQWPLYFARLFIVSGSPQFPDVSILAVSHTGVYLARRDTDNVSVLRSVPFGELQGASTLPRPAALQLNLKNGNRLTLHAPRAPAIQNMVQLYCQEFKQVQSKASSISSGARAAAQTLNVPLERMETPGHIIAAPLSQSPQQRHNESTSSTHNIKQNQHHHSGMQHGDMLDIDYSDSNNGGGMMNGRKSSSPGRSDTTQSRNEHNQHHHHHHKNSINNHHQDNNNMMMITSTSSSPQNDDQSPTSFTGQSVTKYSLLQFAMQHFRNDSGEENHIKTGRSDKRSSTGSRPHADLVKWQGGSLRSPLLRLPADLVPLAIECFDCILRYCGDLPLDPDLTEVKCVYTVLMHCHKHLALRDEVYCQLMKQTTANRSPCVDSAQRAWRLLSILAAYFGCSDALRPYLMEHLSSAASDRRRSCHGTAAVCLSNLRKTARCGGRKNVPSVEEVTAVSAGRSARRQIYRLPGGAERVVNTRCSTVVADVISELCALLGIDSTSEQQEFSLYCIVQGDAFTMPLAADEYILDVTTELLKSGQPFYLIFCRSVWHYPLKRDPIPSPLYIEVLFNQVAPDYLEGLLLELPGGGAPAPEVVRDMARIAAVLHRAADLNHVPAMKEIKFLLPKPALGIRELRPAQWVALVQSAWPPVAGLNPIQVKGQFLNILSTWPLFGSSFFAVKRVLADEGPTDDPNPMWKELILALNRRGVLFLDPNTHEAIQNWAFTEVISTRKVRSEDGALFLDMKVGNLMQQRVIRVQTEQAHEISRLVRQYITMAQVQQRDRRE